jgi:hypothetical protein
LNNFLASQSEQNFARRKNRFCEPFFGLSGFLPVFAGVSSGVSWAFYSMRQCARRCGGRKLGKMREYWLFALWCALVLGLAEWPREH